jgi:hypothetical protein
MLKNKFAVAVIVLTVAAITGVVAGRYYTGQVQANDGGPEIVAVQNPEWTDLKVVYLLDNSNSASDSLFASAEISAKFNAEVITQFSDLSRFSEEQPLDVVIINASALGAVPTEWAKSQYAHGTAFVGLNLTPYELGTFIGDDDFANNKNWIDLKFSEPFVSLSMYRVSGNPIEIEKLEQAGALFPITAKTENIWGDLGIKDVTVKGVQGYTNVNGDDLSLTLDSIRINIDLNSVKRP